MTKNAQQALKQLLQCSSQNVRFCLICNYISKIDESLKNEFIAIRFNQLPKYEIHKFISNICEKESILITDSAIDTVQHLYDSDIRSMINFIQLNQSCHKWEKSIITNEIYDKMYQLLLDKNVSIHQFIEFIQNMSIQYNTDKRNIIKNFLQYMICFQSNVVTSEFLNTSEFIIHNIEAPIDTSLKYLYHHLLHSSL
jgi:replication factor C subunit 3/5